MVSTLELASVAETSVSLSLSLAMFVHIYTHTYIYREREGVLQGLGFWVCNPSDGDSNVVNRNAGIML